jgi:hypothetical protein
VSTGTLYNNYALLGDDLVVGDREVKDQYLKILDALGVECGLHKSVLSPQGIGLEFAKRTFYKGQDISPVPIMEFIMANLTLPSALAFAVKYELAFPRLLKALGYGYRVLGSLNKHIGSLNSRVRALWMGYYAPPLDDPDLIQKYLDKGNPVFKTLTGVSAEVANKFALATLSWIQDSSDALNKIVVTDLVKSEVDKTVRLI